ncbi:integrase core domain-containing protein [Salmonella enterica]|uniref:integrase core domain-containing protein n=1 Tax=Salmonella enterica TaxID=28901 RepID=UPI003735D1AC
MTEFKRTQRDYPLSFKIAVVEQVVKESVAIYNHERPHLALKYKTPDDVHQAFYRQKTVNLYQD